MDVDYKRFPVGSAISAAGIIAKCRECGRVGELRHDPGQRYTYRCVHATRTEPRVGKAKYGDQKLVITHECKVSRKQQDRSNEAAMAALLWLLGENPRLAVDSDMLREHMLRRERAAA